MSSHDKGTYMNITKVIEKTAFNNAVMKLILNVRPIEMIINDFAVKEFDEWETRECEHCNDDRKCKKHRALDRVMDSERAVRITGLDIPNTVEGVFISKSDIFIVNVQENSCLIIDCPPFQTSKDDVEVSDSWVRKIIPFTFGNFNKDNTIEVVQEIDIDKLFGYRTLTCPFGRMDNGDGIRKKNLILHNVYGDFHWEIRESITSQNVNM